MLIDAHFHLDFIPKSQRQPFLDALESHGVQAVAQTLLPSDYLEQHAWTPRCSLGLHPWQLGVLSKERIEEELALFEQALPTTQLIGEVGLDFAPRRVETADEPSQVAVLRKILQLVAQDEEPRVLSLHAVRSVEQVLDLTQNLPEHITAVIHWFSGSSDELTRHIRQGGMISVNPRMLASKRGRAYVKQVPANCLLLETDLPQEERPDISAKEVADTLRATVDKLSELRGEDIQQTIETNQQRIFGG